MDRHLNPSGFSLDAYSFVRGVWVEKPVCPTCSDADQSDSDDCDYDCELLYDSDDYDDRDDAEAAIQEATEYQHDESGFDLFD